MKEKDTTAVNEEFLNGPILKVIIKNAIPAVIAMIMVMVYNLADTFFISLTNDDYQIAAISFAAPVFMIFMSLGTLFGVGGTSVISRALGAGDTKRVKNASSFCTWSSVVVGIVIMAVVWIAAEPFSVALGAGDNTLGYTLTYLRITVCCGVFSILSNCHSNILRAEGEAMKAMTGTLIGNLLNIILDAVFVLVFNWGIVGVAIATVIGNVVAEMYYLMYFIRGKSNLSISIKDFSMENHIFKDVVAIGISASLANLLASLSAIIVNARLSYYGELNVAAYGVTSKVLLIVSMIGIGIGAGVQPVIGFCYGGNHRKRFLELIKASVLFASGVCAALSILCLIFAEPMVKVFLSDSSAWSEAIRFTKIMLTTAWLTGAFVVLQNTLQAIGAAVPALLASLLRQAVIFVPLVFLMQALVGMYGLIIAQPIADVLSLGIIIAMVIKNLPRE